MNNDRGIAVPKPVKPRFILSGLRIRVDEHGTAHIWFKGETPSKEDYEVSSCDFLSNEADHTVLCIHENGQEQCSGSSNGGYFIRIPS